MAFPSEETKNSIRLSWLSLLEGLNSFEPWQRVLLIGGIILIIPSYWFMRLGTKTAYDHIYKKYQVAPHGAFQNPQALLISTPTVLAVSGGYMAYAKVTNPNLSLSASNVPYTAKFYNANGQQVRVSSGQFYIMPGKDTYIIVPKFLSSEKINSATVETTEVKWQQKFSLPTVAFSAPSPTIYEDKDGLRFEGVVTNESSYQLGAVHIVLFLYDAQGQVVALGDRLEYKLTSHERRAYVLRFPGLARSSVARALPMVETNTADVSNIQTTGERLEPNLPVQK